MTTQLVATTTRQLRCLDCLKEFEFPPEDQLFFSHRGWADPIRCRPCRRRVRELRSALNDQRATAVR